VGEGDGRSREIPRLARDGDRLPAAPTAASTRASESSRRYLWSQKIMPSITSVESSRPRPLRRLDFIATNFRAAVLWTTTVPSLDVSYARLMDDLERANIPIVQGPMPRRWRRSRRRELIAQRRHRCREVAQQQLDGIAIQLRRAPRSCHRRHRVGRRAAMLEKRADLHATILKCRITAAQLPRPRRLLPQASASRSDLGRDI